MRTPVRRSEMVLLQTATSISIEGNLLRADTKKYEIQSPLELPLTRVSVEGE